MNVREEFRNLTFSSGPFFDGVACRVYPGTIDENALLPAIGYASVGGTGSTLTMSGSNGQKRARIQFTATAETYADAVQLIGVLSGGKGTKGLFDGFQGELPNGIFVQLARLVTEPIDSYIEIVRLYCRHVDVSFIYKT